MKVVLDCGHGAASVVARTLFEALGCEVISQYCEVDGNFPAHHPDPGKEESLGNLYTFIACQLCGFSLRNL